MNESETVEIVMLVAAFAGLMLNNYNSNISNKQINGTKHELASTEATPWSFHQLAIADAGNQHYMAMRIEYYVRYMLDGDVLDGASPIAD